MARHLFQLRKRLALFMALFLTLIVVAASASAAPWRFGIISDTQWNASPDGRNPNYVAVNVINHLNQEFIDHDVKFVVAVGDVTQYGDILGMDTSATFRQALYNAGIGFYPLRGNHESSASAAAEFVRVFPQTQTGVNNQTPTDALVTTPYYGASPANTGSAFTMGSNFSSPSADFTGLTYAFDYENARFVLIDQFTPASGVPHAVLTRDDVEWVGAQLSTRPANTHAFVFAHKHLNSETHADTLFGSNPSANPDGLQDLYMAYLFDNGVRFHIGGHDHMHNRALITSPDGSSVVQDIITASDSNKFYIPNHPSNDDVYNIPANGITNGPREMEISQELFTIGYYIVTVDGPRVTVDYYASPNGCGGDCGLQEDTIPYAFSKRETFGYSLNGREFLVAQGDAYSVVKDHFGGTSARILDGWNASLGVDYAGRPFTKAIDTGWTPRIKHTPKKDQDTASQILSLWGMTDIGSDHTDTYALSMSYDPAKARPEHLGKGYFGLATRDNDGKWVNAVGMNIGGTARFVHGPWQSGYELGTYGVDAHTRTVWAVINHEGDFAAAAFDGNGRKRPCRREHHRR